MLLSGAGAGSRSREPELEPEPGQSWTGSTILTKRPFLNVNFAVVRSGPVPDLPISIKLSRIRDNDKLSYVPICLNKKTPATRAYKHVNNIIKKQKVRTLIRLK